MLEGKIYEVQKEMVFFLFLRLVNWECPFIWRMDFLSFLFVLGEHIMPHFMFHSNGPENRSNCINSIFIHPIVQVQVQVQVLTNATFHVCR